MKKITVGLIGATGYAGAELVNLLLDHPGVKLLKIAARSGENQPLDEVYPGLAGSSLCCEPLDESSFKDCEYVFLALPHGVSMKYVPSLLDQGSRVIDLGADFRFKDPKTYRAIYQQDHSSPELLGETVYGLPEFFREKIRKARLIGNPGCYPTASLLALKPLLDAELVEEEGIIIDAKSGASGAGRRVAQDGLFTELNENLRPYKVLGHRHTGEIECYAKKGLQLTFTPHLLPVQRGILATIYLTLRPGVTEAELTAALNQAYANEPFVQVQPKGTLPELRWVVRSNQCHIGFELDLQRNRLVVVSVLDNLVKGAAGQSIQNFNLMAGFSEETGLPLRSAVV